MIKQILIILLIAVIFITAPLYSQVIYSGSIREQIERWEGKNSKNIIDYVLKLQLQLFGRKKNICTNYFLVIRTEINGWNPVGYQITLREDNYGGDDNRLMLIFEHPIEKSIQKQYEELLKANPDISLEEAAPQIKMKQDTVIIDSTFKHFNLINEMYTLELPVIYDRSYIIHGTWLQVYIENGNNVHYGLFQLGGNKYAEWVERLFMTMIGYFNAIDPYPKKENK